jgi:hypothetical protein
VGERLTSYAQRWLRDRAALEQQLVAPLLLWDAEPASGAVGTVGTEAGPLLPAAPARPGQPVVLELKKAQHGPNPFTMGVTVGRSETNDLVLSHTSVSRFHAYFRQEPRTHEWLLVDAESKNGTWLGPLRLKTTRPEPVLDKSRLRFGSVEVDFLMPGSFLAELRRRMNG